MQRQLNYTMKILVGIYTPLHVWSKN